MNPSVHAGSAQAGATEPGDAPAAQFLTGHQLGMFPEGASQRCCQPPDNKVSQGPGARRPGPERAGSDSWPGPHVPAPRTRAGDAPTPPALRQNGGRTAAEPGAPGPWPPRGAPRENGGSPGAGPGRAGQAEAGPASAPRAGQGRGSLTGLGRAGRHPLRLRVVAVPVLGRRRLGLLARSPRRGSGARPLRCLPPASAPGDGRPRRRRRRLRGRTSAPGLPRRPPRCCTRSLGLRPRLLLRGPAPPSPSPSPGSPRLALPQAAPLPAPGPSPALTCALRSRRGRDVGRRRNAPCGRGRPRAAGRTQGAGVRAGRAKGGVAAKSRSSAAPEFLFFALPLKCRCSAASRLPEHAAWGDLTPTFCDRFLNSTKLYFCPRPRANLAWTESVTLAKER